MLTKDKNIDWVHVFKIVITFLPSYIHFGHFCLSMKTCLTIIYICPLVVDVYLSWCGPCTAIAGTFKKIKLDLGDALLHFVGVSFHVLQMTFGFRSV